MYCSFFAWPFVFEDSLKISGVFCGKKIIFLIRFIASNHQMVDKKEKKKN